MAPFPRPWVQDTVFPGVADADDEGVGLGGVDGLTALEEFRGGGGESVAVEDVDCVGCAVGDDGGGKSGRAPFEGVGEGDLVG